MVTCDFARDVGLWFEASDRNDVERTALPPEASGDNDVESTSPTQITTRAREVIHVPDRPASLFDQQAQKMRFALQFGFLASAVGLSIASGVAASATCANNSDLVDIPLLSTRNETPSIEMIAGNSSMIVMEISSIALGVLVPDAACQDCASLGLAVSEVHATDLSECSVIGLAESNWTRCLLDASIEIGGTRLDGFPLSTTLNGTFANDTGVTRDPHGASGSFGLEASFPPGIPGNTSLPSIPVVMYERGLISQPAAGFYFGDVNATGTITLGNFRRSKHIDESLSVLLTHPEQYPRFSQLYNRTRALPMYALDEWRIGNVSYAVNTTWGLAIGTFVHAIDENIAPAMVAQVHGGQAVPYQDYVYGQSWKVPCNFTGPSSSIFLGGVEWPIDPKDWVIGPDKNGECTSAITAIKTSPAVPTLIGNPFLRNVYTVMEFDTGAARIYKLKH